MYEYRIRPEDKHLMQPNIEYCYMDCSVDYASNTASVRIAIFDLEGYQDEIQDDVSENGLRILVAAYEQKGWQHLHVENGREYEGHYFQRPLAPTNPPE